VFLWRRWRLRLWYVGFAFVVVGGEVVSEAMVGDKQLAFETLLDRGKVRLLFLLDYPGVVVPAVARERSPNGRALALDYSRRFSMPKFEVNGLGVRAVLTFGGRSAETFVPWGAVVGMAQEGRLVEVWAPPEPLVGEGGGDFEFEIDAEDAKWLARTPAEG